MAWIKLSQLIRVYWLTYIRILWTVVNVYVHVVSDGIPYV